LRDAKWVCATSLSGAWKANLDKIFSVKGIKIAWNPGHRQILASLKVIGKYLAKVAVLAVNKDEAIELVMSDKKYKNKSRVFFEEVNNLLSVLHGYGPQIVLITKGRYGANAFDGKKVYFQPVIKEKRRVDTTGVGDAFGSSFVAGLELYRGNIKKALYLGARNTASVISQPGAQNGLLKKKDIKDINES
jgi:sugar/nucleoside kinase (ribokinase family)